jgi:hypothetical protein
MQSAAMMGGPVLFVLAMAGVATGQISSADIQRQQRQMKARHERRAVEMKRLHEQRVRQMRAAPQQSNRKKTVFDRSTAPSPVDCLGRYVVAARSARSIGDLFKYLPLAEQHSLKTQQEDALARHKRIAGGILDVLSVRVEGRKAVVQVSTTRGGRINGVEHPYGTARVELLGEKGFWKFYRYNDSGVVYMNPPQPKP